MAAEGASLSEPEIFGPGTLLAHDPLVAGGPMAPPIQQTSLFTFKNVAEMQATFAGQRAQPIYSRVGNPTVELFQDKVAALEGGAAARAFASGMAAISSAILAHVAAGERIVCVRNVYPDTYRLLRKLLPRLAIEVDFVDGRDLAALDAALTGARLLYLESPTSLVFDVHDLAAQAALARNHGVTTMCDNSWATPIHQRPLAQGIDMVVHSASKYLSGHSDTVAGVIVGSKTALAAVDDLTMPYLGGKLGPFEAWLLIRGLRTLPLRMRRHRESGLEIARWLAARAEVVCVRHPAFEPGCRLEGCSSLFAIELAPDVDIARFCDRLRLFHLGVSWGGYESLVFPALVGLGQSGGPNALRDFGVSDRLVRLHVGLEEAADLIADLDRAFDDAT
jgi:cystathionine beta-lyase/cystathionine gamma-synthase